MTVIADRVRVDRSLMPSAFIAASVSVNTSFPEAAGFSFAPSTNPEAGSRSQRAFDPLEHPSRAWRKT